ncbi:MAG: hypothetical protein Tsb002_20860 [Wenzhouxiangellaceae bacterium]
MIQTHCTKKLLARLPLHENGRLPGKRPTPFAANDDGRESPLSGWHANLLLIQRRQCVMFVHDATRFPVFIPMLQKADFTELDYFFCDSFMFTLLKTGADNDLMTRAQTMLAPLVCDSNCDRSVQGTMNQMTQGIGIAIEYDGINISEISGYQISAWLADRPCTTKGQKGCIWPIQAMHGLIRSE